MGISMTTSGLPICQPWAYSIGLGASFGLPSFAPESAQATSVSISAWLSRRSLVNLPCASSENQGGIFLLSTAVFMAFAQGRASLYVSNAMGAASPGRWHSWQRFCRSGSTSLWNVTSLPAQSAAMTNSRERTRSISRSLADLLPLELALTTPLSEYFFCIDPGHNEISQLSRLFALR